MRGRRAARKMLRLAYAPPPVHHGVLTQFAPLLAALFPARWFQTTPAAARGRGRGNLSLSLSLDRQQIVLFFSLPLPPLISAAIEPCITPIQRVHLKSGFRAALLQEQGLSLLSNNFEMELNGSWWLLDWILWSLYLFLTKLCSGGWSIFRRLVVGLMNLQTWSFEPKELGFQCDGMLSVT